MPRNRKNNRALFKAISDAEKAANFILKTERKQDDDFYE